ncbi:MAG: hypothetical protein ACYCZF_06290 [Anaerolineae bacterium]
MPDDRPQDAAYMRCSICAQLAEEEYAYQKYGSDIDNSSLPAAADSLILIKDFSPYGSRRLQLERCPECGTHYLYRTDYEYLVNGSEDEQFLTRLSEETAAEYLNRPAKA